MKVTAEQKTDGQNMSNHLTDRSTVPIHLKLKDTPNAHFNCALLSDDVKCALLGHFE